MRYIFSLIIGYLLGSLSPAMLISKRKNKNLREHGTGNLGATNTMLVFGKKYGIFVMLFDIAKGFAAVWIGRLLLPLSAIAGILAGGAAVAGHIFPFYLGGKGGKGLAAFGGMVLGLDPRIFFRLLILGVVMMLVVNYTFALPMSAAGLFPFLYARHSWDTGAFILSVIISLLLITVHLENMARAFRGEEIPFRDYLRDHLFR